MTDDLTGELIKAVQERDAKKMRELSNTLSDKAATEQEDDIIKLALITYSLHKIYSKVHFKEKAGHLSERLTADLSTGDLDSAIEKIKEFDSEHGFFHGDIIEKARIKIGSRLYSRGLSLSKSANLAGTTIKDLLRYVGSTKTEFKKTAIPVSERLENTRKLIK